jgi:hypothetical protein
MNRNLAWILGGVLAAGLVGFGLAQALAQRGDGPRNPPGPGFGIGRFQYVRSDGASVILLDTVTGDLFEAKFSDIKSYKDRPRPSADPVGPPPDDSRERDKDRPRRTDESRPARETDRFRDKDGPPDKDAVKRPITDRKDDPPPVRDKDRFRDKDGDRPPADKPSDKDAVKRPSDKDDPAREKGKDR